jgi:Tol biopolymer transport system component
MHPNQAARRPSVPRTLSLAALSVGILPIGLAPAAVASCGPPQNGRIAYSVGGVLPGPDLDAASQVYTVYPNGTGRKQLTHVVAPVQAGDPSYSPDGRRILYVSNASGRFQIWVMNADGSDQHRLVNDPGHDAFLPSWSPDASTLVFTRCAPVLSTFECTIATVRADGSRVRTVTGGHWQDFIARFTPDGASIVFSSNRSGYLARIWRCALDGSQLRALTDPDLEAFWPDYSPDGQRILFTSNFERPLSQLYTMAPNGAAVRQLTHFTQDNQGGAASYSPDGTRIVLSATGGLAVMNANGTGLTTIVPINDLVIADWGART